MSAPLVLLHPLGADQGFWDGVVSALEPLNVVTLDLPGHGEAALPPPRPSIEVFADQVVDAISELGGPVDLAGVSLGGLVSQEVAARRPDLVRRLVLVDTVATYPEPMRQLWRERATIARERGLDELTGPMEAMWFTTAFLEGPDDELLRIRKSFLAMDAEGYARACEALETADTRGHATAITAPTLVVCGDDDAPPFRETAVWLSEQIADCRLRWLPGRHAVVLERPDEFAAAVREFLA
jgi:3-oxoadipate enol-lactonase